MKERVVFGFCLNFKGILEILESANCRTVSFKWMREQKDVWIENFLAPVQVTLLIDHVSCAKDCSRECMHLTPDYKLGKWAKSGTSISGNGSVCAPLV